MRRRTSMAAAGGAVIAAAAWRRARAGSPAAAGRGRPARPPRRAGRAARRRSGGRRDPSDGTATPAPSSSCRKRTAPSPTACTGTCQREQPRGERRGRERGGREQRAARPPRRRRTPRRGGRRARRRRRRSPAPAPAASAGERARPGTSGSPRPCASARAVAIADPQAGEAARADADGDPLDVVPGDAGLGQRLLEQRQQPRGVVAARARRRVVARLDDAAVGEQHAGDGGRRGGVERERRSRAAHLDPAPVAAGVRERDVPGDRAAAEQRRGLRALGPLDERDGVRRRSTGRAARGPRRRGRRAGRGRGARAGPRAPS